VSTGRTRLVTVGLVGRGVRVTAAAWCFRGGEEQLTNSLLTASVEGNSERSDDEGQERQKTDKQRRLVVTSQLIVTT